MATAADQIRNKEYMQKLEHYKGNILVISVNYDKEADTESDDYKTSYLQDRKGIILA